jgi:hypothetical protein
MALVKRSRTSAEVSRMELSADVVHFLWNKDHTNGTIFETRAAAEYFFAKKIGRECICTGKVMEPEFVCTNCSWDDLKWIWS